MTRQELARLSEDLQTSEEILKAIMETFNVSEWTEECHRLWVDGPASSTIKRAWEIVDKEETSLVWGIETFKRDVLR